MTDQELLQWNSKGFIPGPLDSETSFLQRIEETQLATLKLGEEALPLAHWEYVEKKLQILFDFAPRCLPAFYSNRSLMPWQGAAAWVERGRILAIQLRLAFKKGSFLRIYERSEMLAHESVHAARSAFPLDQWDEFFAYMTSEKSWRKVLGPIVQKPWEVWPFLVFCIGSVLSPLAFLGMGAWLSLGCLRLTRGHWILRKASLTLKKCGCNDRNIRAILLRLQDDEIRKVASGSSSWETILGTNKNSLRGRLLELAYPLSSDRNV